MEEGNPFLTDRFEITLDDLLKTFQHITKDEIENITQECNPLNQSFEIKDPNLMLAPNIYHKDNKEFTSFNLNISKLSQNGDGKIIATKNKNTDTNKVLKLFTLHNMLQKPNIATLISYK